MFYHSYQCQPNCITCCRVVCLPEYTLY